jgi:hypothetical protein
LSREAEEARADAVVLVVVVAEEAHAEAMTVNAVSLHRSLSASAA